MDTAAIGNVSHVGEGSPIHEPLLPSYGPLLTIVCLQPLIEPYLVLEALEP